MPSDHFISLLAPVVKDGRVPITDNAGLMLSTDRRHLTRFGAIFLGQREAIRGMKQAGGLGW